MNESSTSASIASFGLTPCSFKYSAQIKPAQGEQVLSSTIPTQDFSDLEPRKKELELRLAKHKQGQFQPAPRKTTTYYKQQLSCNELSADYKRNTLNNDMKYYALQKLSLSTMSSPRLTPRSRQITGERQGNIEDRLIIQGERRRAKQLFLFDKETLRIKQNSTPQITPRAQRIKNREKIEDRLQRKRQEYIQIKDYNRVAQSPKYSFKPKINKFNFTGQAKKKPPLSQKYPLPTFRPTLNEKSRLLAQNVTKRSSKSFEVIKHSFKPTINQKSSNLSPKSEDIWGDLYQLSFIYREKKALLQKQIDNKQEVHPFSPQINKTKLNINPKNVIERLMKWDNLRKERLQKKQSELVDPELEHCTFSPIIRSLSTGRMIKNSSDLSYEYIAEPKEL